MIVEFARRGKTYQFTLPVPMPPPPTITIPFRECPLRPLLHLELMWRATDDVRGVELYRPTPGGA